MFPTPIHRSSSQASSVPTATPSPPPGPRGVDYPDQDRDNEEGGTDHEDDNDTGANNQEEGDEEDENDQEGGDEEGENDQEEGDEGTTHDVDSPLESEVGSDNALDPRQLPCMVGENLHVSKDVYLRSLRNALRIIKNTQAKLKEHDIYLHYRITHDYEKHICFLEKRIHDLKFPWDYRAPAVERLIAIEPPEEGPSKMPSRTKRKDTIQENRQLPASKRPKVSGVLSLKQSLPTPSQVGQFQLDALAEQRECVSIVSSYHSTRNT